MTHPSHYEDESGLVSVKYEKLVVVSYHPFAGF